MAESRQTRIERKRQQIQRLKKRRMQAQLGPNAVKTSALLADFARPLLDLAPDSAEAWLKSLTVAAMVWNDVVQDVPQAETVARLEPMLSWEDAYLLVGMLVKRKQEHFSADLRVIVDVRTEPTANGVAISAGAALLPGHR